MKNRIEIDGFICSGTDDVYIKEIDLEEGEVSAVCMIELAKQGSAQRPVIIKSFYDVGFTIRWANNDNSCIDNINTSFDYETYDFSIKDMHTAYERFNISPSKVHSILDRAFPVLAKEFGYIIYLKLKDAIEDSMK